MPRCLLGLRDRADEHTISTERDTAWLDYEFEALRWGVDSDVSREGLAAMVEGSTMELDQGEHREIHAGDFARWGRRGGLTTLRRYGTVWFSLLAKRRWEKISRRYTGGGLRGDERGAAMTAVLFPLGRIVATPGALSLLAVAGVNPAEFLERHRRGDWGEVPPRTRARTSSP